MIVNVDLYPLHNWNTHNIKGRTEIAIYLFEVVDLMFEVVHMVFQEGVFCSACK